VGVSRGGRVVFQQGYGLANLETLTPIRPGSIFHAASIAKQFTSAAILLLERDGKLSLDDDIRKYVPEVPDYGTAITIRHLLTHTSGLRDELELVYFARGRFEEDRITEADVMDLISRQTALNFVPGSESVYSNTGYTLAALIVKRASGQSLRDFAAERIFRPLGMSSTHFHDDFTMVVPGRTSGYERRGGPDGPWRVAVSPYDIYGSTNLLTTVGDILKWAANFDRPIVGDDALFMRMRATATLTNGDTSEYGLGLRRERSYRGTRVLESTGNDPGYQVYVGRYPDQQFDVVVMCNAGSAANPTLLAHGVADVLLGRDVATASPATTQTGTAVPTASLSAHAGVYMEPTTGAIVGLVMRDSQLAIAGSGGRALIPLGSNRFAVVGEAGDLLFSADARAGYLRRIPGQRALRFEWHEPVAPSRQTLAPYAGEYVSPELGGAVYHVTATDSTLVMRVNAAPPLIAHVVFEDTFLSGGYTIQFTKSGRKVTGFEVTNARMRRVKFTKRPETT
jgi:CubicO group peptidase (beta-lactamase class C family)